MTRTTDTIRKRLEQSMLWALSVLVVGVVASYVAAAGGGQDAEIIAGLFAPAALVAALVASGTVGRYYARQALDVGVELRQRLVAGGRVLALLGWVLLAALLMTHLGSSSSLLVVGGRLGIGAAGVVVFVAAGGPVPYENE